MKTMTSGMQGGHLAVELVELSMSKLGQTASSILETRNQSTLFSTTMNSGSNYKVITSLSELIKDNSKPISLTSSLLINDPLAIMKSLQAYSLGDAQLSDYL